MIGPFLVLDANPPLMLAGVGDETAGLCYSIVRSIGAIHHPADGSETANVSIELDNSDGTATELLADPPLRRSARLFGADGSIWFAGILAGVRLGETATLDLEA